MKYSKKVYILYIIIYIYNILILFYSKYKLTLNRFEVNFTTCRIKIITFIKRILKYFYLFRLLMYIFILLAIWLFLCFLIVSFKYIPYYSSNFYYFNNCDFVTFSTKSVQVRHGTFIDDANIQDS
jgi:hypothetical protein